MEDCRSCPGEDSPPTLREAILTDSEERGNADRPSIFRHFDPYPDALDTLRSLDEAGHKVVIITAKPRWAVTDTLRWLADHDVPTTEIHLEGDLDEAQRARLLEIAARCPVHRTLHSEVAIQSRLA